MTVEVGPLDDRGRYPVGLANPAPQRQRVSRHWPETGRRLKAGLGCANVKLVVGKQRRRMAYRAVGASKEPLRTTLLRWRQRRIVAG